MVSFFKNSRLRAWFIQALVLLATVGTLASFILITRQNLLDLGIATGFGFLDRSTGWPINFALFEVTARSPYAHILLAGLLNTLLVGLLGISLAVLLGVIVGLMRVSRNFVLNLIGTTFVEAFRNVPLILQVFVWYAIFTHLPSPRGAISIFGFGFLSNRGLMLPTFDMSGWDIVIFVLGTGLFGYLIASFASSRDALRRHVWPLILGVVIALFVVLLFIGRTPGEAIINVPELRGLRFIGGVAIKPEFSALLVAIAVFGGAYIGEIVRGGILSIDRGQIEAARALGLSNYQVNRLVTLPLAFRAILPALANQIIWLMKATTLGIAIGYPDYFMVVSTSINQSGQTIELLSLLMGGFLVINYSIGFAMNRLNRHLAIKGQGG